MQRRRTCGRPSRPLDTRRSTPQLQSFAEGDIGEPAEDLLVERVRAVAEELGCAPSPALARRVFLEFQSDSGRGGGLRGGAVVIESQIAAAHPGHGGGSIERARREWAAQQDAEATLAADDALADAYERSVRHRVRPG